MHRAARRHTCIYRSICCSLLRNCRDWAVASERVRTYLTQTWCHKLYGGDFSVCVSMCVFLHFYRTKEDVWFPHWCIVGIEWVGEGGVECWDKPLNFDLERQAASGLKTGEEEEGLVCHSLETSWCLFIIILNILCFMGDGHNLLLSFYWYLLNKCLLAIQMV